MFGFLKKAVLPSAEQEIDNIFNKIKFADRTIQVSLHLGTIMMYKIFLAKFETLENFKILDNKEKHQYLMKLIDVENELTREKKFAESLGAKVVGLFLSTYLDNGNDFKYKAIRERVLNFISSGELVDVSEKPNSDKIIINCPGCNQKLRVPSNKKIEISCPSCDLKWIEPT